VRMADAADFSDPFEGAPLLAMGTAITLTREEISTYFGARVPNLKQRRAAEWRGACPIHHGKNDNFAVDPETGRWFCHSACGRGGDILELEAALTAGDFSTRKAEVFRIIGRVDSRNGSRAARAGIAATYDYTDEKGGLLYQAVRMDPKDFRQRRPNGNERWIWNLKGVRLVLYRLRELVQRATETVFVCEGEKDVHSLESLGLLATCNGMGAGKWRPEYSDALRGRSVVILPDNDKPGRKHAGAVSADLLRVGCKVRIVEIPSCKDVSDWLGAGGTLEELRTLASEQPTLTDETLAAWRAQWERETATERATGDKGLEEKSASKSSAFRLTDDGVIYFDPDPDKEPLRICGRLEVAAVTRDSKGDGWGRLLRWTDSEGRAHEWAMPMSLLAGDGNEYRARLLDGGLFLAPGRKSRELLTVYLQSTQPQTRALCVARIGWHSENFVLPGATIGPENAETVLFQTPSDADHFLSVSGTVGDWRENVGRFCSGNSRLILAASCGFAGPLLSLMGGESGGIHFVGATSTGKSTALVVGGSVLGGGGRNGFVQSWRTTANGLEAIAELHNDLTLFLDELAQMDPRDAGDAAYLLGNGTGKTRMSRNIGARKKLSWSLLYVSAGEVTLADHVQTAGKRTKGGAEVRLLNIEADAGAGMGLFENIHSAESPDAFARQLKDAARRFYGAPFRTYLDFLTVNRAAAEKALRNFQEDFLARHVPAGASGEVSRAAHRLALIAAAGELATEAGITWWKENEATDAAARCFENWLTQRGTAGALDIETAIRQVKNFIEVNGASRFQSMKARLDGHGDPVHEKVINRAGFRVEEDGETTMYLILPEVFRREVCEGFDFRTVAKTLEARGFLETQLPHLAKKRRLPDLGIVRVYAAGHQF
jgi:putative DNA primase/helicase